MREVFYLHPDGEQQNIVHRPITTHLHGRRVSRVTPEWLPYRWAFYAIRYWYGDDSPMAAWTRSWRCHWRADVRVELHNAVSVHYLGRFETREAAIVAEVRCLESLLDTVMERVRGEK